MSSFCRLSLVFLVSIANHESGFKRVEQRATGRDGFLLAVYL